MGRRAYLSRHNFDRSVAGVLTLALFAASYYRNATFRSTNYDLGIFQQAVWKMAHGLGSGSTLVGWSIFADHLSPILLVFVPLFRLAATPLWFFGAQALALGVGALCVRPLAEAVGLDETTSSWAPLAFVAAYALNPAVWNASVFDFHPLTLAVPVLMIACIAALRHDHRMMVVTLIAMVLLRDDLTVAASAIALVGWRSDDRAGKRTRVLIAVAGVAWMLIGAHIGSAMGSDRYFANRYGYVGATPTAALSHPWSSLVGVFHHVVQSNNTMFVVALLLPFAFLSLGAPAWLALAVFLMLPNLASADHNLQLPNFQYGAPLLPLVLLASIGGLRRLDPRKQNVIAAYVAGVAGVCFLFFGPPATGFLSVTAVKPADAQAAIASLRPSDGVSATDYLGPHLADRVTLLPFPAPFVAFTPTFPLSPAVTSNAASVQRRVNVVILPTRSITNGNSFVKEFITETAKPQGFVATTFGTVTVFRRP